MTESKTQTFVNGLISGSVGALAVYPIDVVKTRMQNQNKSLNKLYKNGFDCWYTLWKQGRFSMFYKGCIPQMIGVAPEKAVKLFAYSHVTKNHEDEFLWHVLGGVVAGTSQVAITSPYEMIKINLQMNNRIDYKSLMSFKKLYTGASACLLRDVPFSAIYFPAYWYLKQEHGLHPFIAGTMAGVPAAYLCTPADVVKTRLQTLRAEQGSLSLYKTIKHLYEQEGFMAFWKGGLWRVLRSSPQFGITLVIYEELNQLESWLKK